MPSNNRGRNNNPEGYNQHKKSWTDTARERPAATAAAAAAAVGAGVFLWSRRNQISDQLSNLSDQVGEWTSSMRQGQESRQFEMAGGSDMSSGSSSATGSSSMSSGSTSRRGKSSGMSETGSGTSSLGAHSGGGGMSTAPSGRGRA